MAFNDDPQVDIHAERSEESILKCKLFFSKKNGFISHSIDGTNDYGSDISCQLIENNSVTPFQFPIQVKSKISYKEKIVNDEVFLTTLFKNSRLSFLINHTPVTGLIVLFDEKSDKIYFDFAYEIYNRIRISHENDSWKDQECITILIPKLNVLNDKSLSSIHDLCLSYFKNCDKLLTEQGRKIGLPIFGDDNFSKEKSLLEILEDIGELMFFYNKYLDIINVIEQLDNKSIKRPKIAYIGAITYAEIGNILEADYFFKICEKHENQYSKKQIDTLNFQKFKFNFYSGKVSRNKLKEMLEKMDDSLTDSDDIIYLKINLLNLDLLDGIGQEGFDEIIIQKSNSIFIEIKKANTSELAKKFQFISVSDILSKAINSKLMTALIDSKIIESIGGIKRTPSRVILMTRINSIYENCLKHLQDSLEYAQKEKNDLLLAHSNLGIATLFFGQCLSFFMAKEHFENRSFSHSMLEEIYKSSLSAHNIFTKLGLMPFAYTSITISSEIYLLGKHWENIDLNYIADITKINEVIRSFQDQDFKRQFVSVVEKIHQRHIEIDSVFTSEILMNEDHIDILAKSFIRHNDLDESRLNNIKTAIRNDQVFRSRCNNNDLILTSDQKPFGKDAYLIDRPKYAIFTKTNNLLIAEDYDLEKLLQKLGF